MARRERPVSASLIQKEFGKARAKLRTAKKKMKSPAERTVIDLQLKTLTDCERLLNNIMLI